VSDRKAYPLRLRPEYFQALRSWADDELRSVNAQIEFLLVKALKDAGRFPRTKKPPRKGGRS
jgi:hypothetical protein